MRIQRNDLNSLLESLVDLHARCGNLEIKNFDGFELRQDIPVERFPAFIFGHFKPTGNVYPAYLTPREA
jgi:hypothetical protein